MTSFLFWTQTIGFLICVKGRLVFIDIFPIYHKKCYYLLTAVAFLCIGIFYNFFKLHKSGIKNNFERYAIIFITSLFALVCIAQFLINIKWFDDNLIGDVVGGTVSLVSILFALYKYVEVKDSKSQIEPVIILKKGIYKENNQYYISNAVSQFSIKVCTSDSKKKFALLGFCINDSKTVDYIQRKNKNYDDRIYDYQNNCQLSDSHWIANYEENSTFFSIPVDKLKKGLKIPDKSEVVAVLMDESNNIIPFSFRVD